MKNAKRPIEEFLIGIDHNFQLQLIIVFRIMYFNVKTFWRTKNGKTENRLIDTKCTKQNRSVSKRFEVCFTATKTTAITVRDYRFDLDEQHDCWRRIDRVPNK